MFQIAKTVPPYASSWYEASTVESKLVRLYVSKGSNLFGLVGVYKTTLHQVLPSSTKTLRTKTDADSVNAIQLQAKMEASTVRVILDSVALDLSIHSTCPPKSVVLIKFSL